MIRVWVGAHQPGLRDFPKASADHEATLASSSGTSTVAWYGAERGRDDGAESGRRDGGGVSRAAGYARGGGGDGASAESSSRLTAWSATCSLFSRPMRSCSAACTDASRWAAAGAVGSGWCLCASRVALCADSSAAISSPITCGVAK